MKIRGLLVSVIACIIFFVIGILVGRAWYMLSFRIASSPMSTKPAIVAFDIPQVPLPPNWSSKENSPGNSFETAFPLSTGIETQGTLSENNIIDYYVFTLKNPSQIIVNITNVPRALYWVLYDSQFQQAASSYRTGTSQGSSQVALQNPGKYYIKVWANYSQLVNYPYTIRLNILPYFE